MSVEAIRKVQAKYEAELMKRANAVGVAVGLAQSDGQFSDEIALIVLVSQKVPLDQLAEEDRIPAALDGIRVDVQEVGEPYAQGTSVD